MKIASLVVGLLKRRGSAAPSVPRPPAIGHPVGLEIRKRGGRHQLQVRTDLQVAFQRRCDNPLMQHARLGRNRPLQGQILPRGDSQDAPAEEIQIVLTHQAWPRAAT